MSDNHHPDALEARAELADLSPFVFAAIEAGVEEALDFFADQARDPWLFPHIVRNRALNTLQSSLANLDAEIRPLPMSGIEIVYQDRLIRLFKKCGYDQEKFLYPPGNSLGRQYFYNQMPIPEASHLFEDVPNLAYVWDLDGGSVELYLVCPDGYESIWQPGDSQWVIEITHPAQVITSPHSFGADEADDFELEPEDVDGMNDEAESSDEAT